MLRKSIVMMVLVLGVVASAAVAWASAAGPDWHAGPGPMMGSDEPGGAWDEGDWADMARWMEQMHGTSPGAVGEGGWADMARWMEQMHGSGPGLCPHWGYASPGADDTPAG